MDMGSGSSPNKSFELERHGIHTTPIDINRQAISSLRKYGLHGLVSDATRFGSGEMFWLAPGLIETKGGILFQATLSSLLGDTWKSAIEAGHVMLHPSGYMFFTIYLAADRIYDELVNDRFPRQLWQENARKWSTRYEVNRKAFTDSTASLPKYAFAVGRPGPIKEKYDWTTDPSTLRKYYDKREQELATPIFERFAQHTHLGLFDRFMTKAMGYKQVMKRFVIRPSRVGGVMSPGVDCIYQKSEFFQIHPWRKGLSVNDADYWDKGKVRERKAGPMDLDNAYGARLLANLPSSQYEALHRWYFGSARRGLPLDID